MNSILSCLCGTSNISIPPNKQCPRFQYALIDEKPPIPTPPTVHAYSDDDSDTMKLTAEITSLLTKSPTQIAFQTSLNDIISIKSWSEALATSILHTLEETLKNTDRSTWGDFLTSAYNSAVKFAEEGGYLCGEFHCV